MEILNGRRLSELAMDSEYVKTGIGSNQLALLVYLEEKYSFQIEGGFDELINEVDRLQLNTLVHALERKA